MAPALCAGTFPLMFGRIFGLARSLADWTIARTDLAIIAIGTAMLILHVTAILVQLPREGGRIIRGDAMNHFVQLRSLVFDRDLDFRNEYDRLAQPAGSTTHLEWYAGDLTPTGRVRNYMPVGPALLWMPLFLIAVLAQVMLATVHLAPTPDGYGWPMQLVPGITGVLAATAATWWSWRLARQFATATSAAVAALAVWLGSQAIYYSLVSPSYSHAASMLASAIFFATWLGGRDAPSIRRIATWGGLAGLAALMRWQDAIFLLVPVLDAVRWQTSWRTRLIAAGSAVLAWLVVFSPQMAVWNVLYGQPFALPQGPTFMRWTAPHLIDVLVSTAHGLFTWTPMLIPAVWGLVTFMRRQRASALPLLVILVLSWYVNAAVADWWGGEAFGARRFLSLFPLFVLGLATWIDTSARPSRASALRMAIAGAIVVTNVCLLLQYELFMKGFEAIAPYPSGSFDMWVARFVVPFRLLVSWRH